MSDTEGFSRAELLRRARRAWRMESMAIPVGDLRGPAARYRIERRAGFWPDGVCELCQKPIRAAPVMVAIDHCRYEFVTDAEATARGDAVSLFPVGPDCARRIRKALDR